MKRLRPLDRKLMRDLVRLKWQAAAIALLIACGVSVAVMAYSTQRTLVHARLDYYRQTRFGDLFATATRAPLSLVPDLQRIDGVTAVDVRAAKIGLMPVQGMLRPATVHLISLPDDERAALNRIVIVAGRMPDSHRTDEAVALATFLDASHTSLGEILTMTIAGRALTFRIVGAALSPEFVYVPSNGPMPDDAHQAVLWAPRDAVEKPSNLGGAFSTVSLRLAPGASERAACASVDMLLAAYGGSPCVGRADQISDKFQTERITRLGIMAAVLPPVFLLVAAGLVNLVLGRLVEADREQIGLLKAFGYGDLDAAMPYVKLAILIAVAGTAAGGVAGWRFGNLVVAELAQYMRIPHLDARMSWAAFAAAAGVSLVAALGGASAAVLRVARLSPAVAMQPPPPTTFRRGGSLETAILGGVDEPTRMIARNIRRFPLRAIMTAVALAVSITLLSGSQFMYGSIDTIADREWYAARRWTDHVSFDEIRGIHAIAEIARLPSVLIVEPVRIVPGWARAHGAEQRVIVAGVEPDARLSLTLGEGNRRTPVLDDGVVVSRGLARALRAGPGDVVELQPTEGRQPRTTATITSVSNDYSGEVAYMDRRALNRLMADGDVASAADVFARSGDRRELYAALARLPAVVSADSRDDTVASFRSTISAAMTIETGFFLGFASAIAFGVAFNVSRIALTNRARDLATLRVLGFSPAECAYILTGELVVLALPAIPLGLAGGFGVAHVMAAGFARQDFFIPVVLTAHGLALTLGTYAAAIAVAAAIVARRIWALDLVTTLKTRE